MPISFLSLLLPLFRRLLLLLFFFGSQCLFLHLIDLFLRYFCKQVTPISSRYYQLEFLKRRVNALAA